MKSFKEFCTYPQFGPVFLRDEQLTGLDHFFQQISEGSLSRLWRHTQDKDFAIITAYRSNPDVDPEKQKRTNVSNNLELRQQLNAKKMGSYPLIGHWRECPYPGVDYKDCPENDLVDVIERSYFVVRPDHISSDEFLKIIYDLAKKFEQDGVVLQVKSENLFGVYSSEGKELFKFSDGIALNKVSQAYSQYVKKLDLPFVFEGIEIPSGSVFVLDAYHRDGFRWI